MPVVKPTTIHRTSRAEIRENMPPPEMLMFALSQLFGGEPPPFMAAMLDNLENGAEPFAISFESSTQIVRFVVD